MQRHKANRVQRFLRASDRATLLGVNETDPTLVDRRTSAAADSRDGALEKLPEIPGFVFDRLLGAGGMGRVYRARDTHLDRWVAVKILDSSTPETLERFLREAKAQARVQHDHVCPVFEVGTADSHHYIVMALVDGTTLLDAAANMGLQPTLAVVADVADALHAAHETGLIHRDVKPSNILVEGSLDDAWYGWITDFGIAADVTEDHLTQTGTTIGTPSFMAPEQVHGGRGSCDRRTDVYGLGATLYRALTGRPPFEADSSFATMMLVTSSEPTPPSIIAPAITRDLETIILKCLEKEPARRYQTTAALAADLRRFLDGDAIHARRSEWSYRLLKTVRKHRVTAGVIATSCLAIILIGTAAIRSVIVERQRAAYAREFALDIGEIESSIQKSFLMPIHDIRPVIADAEQRMAEIERLMAEAGKAASGPGHYALGRGHLALGRYELAARHLERAWDLGYDRPEVANALGVAFGKRYQEARLRAITTTSGAARDQRLNEIIDAYRSPALRFLRDTANLEDADRARAEGLIAFYEGQLDAALRHAARALELDRSFYRAHLLEADVHTTRGKELFDAGEIDEAAESYDRAEQALLEASAIGRSDPAVHLARCRLTTISLDGDVRRGLAEPNAFAEAISVCEAGLIINPDDVEALSAMSRFHWRWGSHVIRTGDDPLPVLTQAIDLAEKAVAIEPNNGPALNDLGVALSKLGLHALKTGGNPQDHLERAVEAFDRAIKLDAYGHQPFNNRGLAQWRLGQWAMASGNDPLRFFEQAAADFRACITIVPSDSLARVNLGAVLLTAAMYELGLGLDPTESINASITVFRESLDINPRLGTALNSLGAALCTRAEWQQENGLDPRQALDQALETFQRSARENPNNTLVYSNLASAAATRAKYELDTGGDPNPILDQASGWVDRAIELNPRNATAFHNRASVLRMRAQYAIEHGLDPTPFIRDALDDVSTAFKINPSYSSLATIRARTMLIQARHVEQQGRDPRPVLDESERLLLEALETQPPSADYNLELARVHLMQARLAHDRPGSFGTHVQAGLGAAARALELNPALADGWSVQARLLVQQAAAVSNRDKRNRLFTEAVSAFEEAIRLNPLLERHVAEELAEARQRAAR